MRYHCEFKDCKCRKFKLHCNNLCFHCKHANIWHSRKEKPPRDEYLAFESVRLAARTPKYEKKYFQVAIFVPEVPPIPESDDEIVFCQEVNLLPV